MIRQVNYVIWAFVLVVIFILTGLIFKKIVFSEHETTEVTWSTDSTFIKDPTTLNASGKKLFQAQCQSCHSIFKDLIGPALSDFENRGQWSDREKLYSWIQNPPAFMAKDPYTQNLKDQYRLIMPSFPHLTRKEIDDIADYINQIQVDK